MSDFGGNAVSSQPSAVWKSNMTELARWQPKLAAKLTERVTQLGRIPAPHIRETPQGRWIHGLSPSPFFESAQKTEIPSSQKEKPLCFVFGAGAPPFLFHVLRSLSADTLAVVVVEPNLDVLAHLLHTTSVYKALPGPCRLSFLTSEEFEFMDETLHANLVPLGTFVAAQSSVVVHRGEAEAFAAPMASLQKALSEAILLWLQGLGNSTEDTLLGLRQMALMVPWIVFGPRLADLGGAFHGRPFVFVAAGPSLDKNMHLLKGREDRCVIIAAETVLRKLLAEGIKPHIVVALERGTVVFTKHFRKTLDLYGEECRDILLVAQSVCVPQVAGCWPGPKIVLGKKGIPVDEWFIGRILGRELLSAGLSVAHMGATIAVSLGASSVALIGQDLAYGDDGSTHAGATAWSEEQSGDARKTEKQRIQVPGALGGTVWTHDVWLLFIRIFERMIPTTTVPFYDCTEGGALIRGTTVQPFATYLETHVDGLAPFTETPARLLEKKSGDYRSARNVEEVLARLEVGTRALAASRELLGRIEEEIEKTVAPALTPSRRQEHALKVATELDRLHASNPVLAFIAQSYTNLGGLVIAETRRLDDVPKVEKWGRIHREMVEGHRVAMVFVQQWVDYALATVRLYGERGFSEASSLFSLDVLEDACARSSAEQELQVLQNEEAEAEHLLSARIALDNLTARSDPAHRSWPPELLWKLALFLEQEGRNAEAEALLDEAAKSFHGKELDVACITAFLKDYARIAASHDLCVLPRYDKAKLLLRNALSYASKEEERALLEVLVSLLDEETSFWDSVAAMGLVDTPSAWNEMRGLAEKALFQKDLPLAMRTVWRMVRRFAATAPRSCASFAGWLFDTMTKCLEAADPKVRDAIDEILTQAFTEEPLLLRSLTVPLSPCLVRHMERKGLKISFVTTDTEERKEGIARN